MYSFLLLLIASFTAVLGNLDCKTFDEVYLAIDNAITINQELIPPLVRLAFHDCVGTSCNGCINVQDGSNAGLLRSVEALEEIYNNDDFAYRLSRADFWQLAAHVALVRGGLNRPCDHNEEYCHFFDLQFYAGRKDCFTSPDHFTDDDAGDGFGDFKEVWRVLHGYFKMNYRDIAAILGVHSLGGAHRHASGFKYNWQNHHLTFDNAYYQNLVTLPYTHMDVSAEIDEEDIAAADAALPEVGEAVGAALPELAAEAPEIAEVEAQALQELGLETPKVVAAEQVALAPDGGPATPRLQFVYVQPDKALDDLLMLNTDVAIWKDIKAIETFGNHYTGEIRCPTKYHPNSIIEDDQAGVVSGCKNTKTTRYVYEYAQSLPAFYRDFPVAWWKMVSNGYSNLKVPGFGKQKCGNCIPEGGYCVRGFEKAGSCCSGTFCTYDNKCESTY